MAKDSDRHLTPQRKQPVTTPATAPTAAAGEGPRKAKPSDRIPIQARCSVQRDYFAIVFRPGIQMGKAWLACDSYPLASPGEPATTSASQPAPKRIRLVGDILLGTSYPGCPYCTDRRFVQCSTCSGYICLGAAKVTGDHMTYCPTCDYRLRIGEPGLKDMVGSTAPPAKDILGAAPPRSAEVTGKTPKAIPAITAVVRGEK